LKVKSFVDTSRNALLIQVWTALIALLLLKWLHHLSKAKPQVRRKVFEALLNRTLLGEERFHGDARGPGGPPYFIRNIDLAGGDDWKWSFSNLASMLRLNLFTFTDLRRWLENPSAHRR
jgi:hypothetical protein